jgi:DNA-binding response OmpR family regulator
MTQPVVVAVNDEPVQLGQIEALLEGAGHRVHAFTSASDALEALATGVGVDLFVLDLHMPVIDGWKLCRLLRSSEFEAFNHTPIVVTSAFYAGDEVAALTRELGAQAFIEAPFEPSELVSVATDLLGGGAQDRTPTALIVEDDAAVRGSLARSFASSGYTVLEEETLAGARVAWRSTRPDVALLDHHLPDGTSFALLEELASPQARTAVLVMTGDTDPFLPVRLFDRGADGYLRKPFDPAHAVQEARSVARQRSLLRIGSSFHVRHLEQQSAERRLQQSRRLESLGLLAGGIAHEFNNLLVGILGNADLAALDIPDGSPAHGSLEQVSRLARRAAERTRQILAFTGKARLEIEELDLRTLVEQALASLDLDTGEKVRLADGPPGPRLRGDRERLSEVLVSLAMNGVEALDAAAGHVSVAVAVREVRASEAIPAEGGHEVPPGRFAVLEVCDDGTGMDEVTRSRMFDPFFSTKFTGRGLGLAAVLGIVRAHGGWISVRTAPAAGTVVSVFLPALPSG